MTASNEFSIMASKQCLIGYRAVRHALHDNDNPTIITTIMVDLGYYRNFCVMQELAKVIFYHLCSIKTNFLRAHSSSPQLDYIVLIFHYWISYNHLIKSK